MDSNASRAGEVERKVRQDNDFLLPGRLLKMSPLVDGPSAVSTLRKWRQRRRVATGIRATALLAERASQVIVSPSFTEQLRVWPHVPPPFRCLRATSSAQSGLYGVSIRRRSTASSFRFLGLCHFATAWQGKQFFRS